MRKALKSLHKLRFEVSWREFFRTHGLYGQGNFVLFNARLVPELCKGLLRTGEFKEPARGDCPLLIPPVGGVMAS